MSAPFTPVYLTPAQQGMLSNKRGANTGADALAITVRSRHPGAVAAGTLRATAARIFSGGQANPKTTWDGGWTGTPSTAPWPGVNAGAGPSPALVVTAGTPAGQYGTAGRGQVTQTAGGRTYAIDPTPTSPGIFKYSLGEVWSVAPINGGVPPWRDEGPIQVLARHFIVATYPVSACITNNFLYVCLSDGSIVYAAILSDGSIGQWVAGTTKAAQAGTLVGIAPGGNTSPGGNLLILGTAAGKGLTNTASTNVQYIGLNTDGSLQGWVAGTALPVALCNPAVYYDSTSNLLVVAGGMDATPTVQTAIYAAALGTYGAPGAWTTQTNALPAARQAGSVVVDNGFIFYLGGSSTNVVGGGTATAWAAAIGTTVSATTIGAWSAALTPALPQARSYGVAFLTAGVTLDGQKPYVILTGGQDTTGTLLPASYGNQSTGAGGWANGAWSSGASALAVGSLGTGAAIVNNADGSQDITFNYGAFGNAATPALADGDVIQIAVQIADSALGQASPVAYALVKIGQPPTLGNIVPAAASTATTSRPVASLGFTPGAGGGPEKSYRIRVIQGGSTVFDTGLKYDGANSATIKPQSGQGLSNLAYSLQVDVASLDIPMPGSSASATSTTAFNGPTVAPAAPTLPTVAPDGANGWTLLGWTVPASSSFIRIYKRLAGASVWVLYKDNITSAGSGTVQTFQAMEEIAFGQAYDYAFSSVNAAGSESALATALDSGGASALVPPKQPSNTRYTVMLHVVGNGPAQKVGLQLIVVGQRGHAADFTRHQDVQAAIGFGNLAPTVRLGTFTFHSILLKPIISTAAGLAAVEAVMAAAMAGSTLCYRDTLGKLLYCSLTPSRTRREGRFNEDDLNLVETSFAYAA